LESLVKDFHEPTDLDRFNARLDDSRMRPQAWEGLEGKGDSSSGKKGRSAMIFDDVRSL
jgi:hypothetical protein